MQLTETNVLVSLACRNRYQSKTYFTQKKEKETVISARLFHSDRPLSSMKTVETQQFEKNGTLDHYGRKKNEEKERTGHPAETSLRSPLWKPEKRNAASGGARGRKKKKRKKRRIGSSGGFCSQLEDPRRKPATDV